MNRPLRGWSWFIITAWLIFFPTTIAAPRKLSTLTTGNSTTTQNSTQAPCPAPNTADYIVFFAGNFFSHAGTIINRPGVSGAERLILVVFALLSPGTGITRAYDVFIRFISERSIKAGLMALLTCWGTCGPDKNDAEDTKRRKALQNAAHAGALVVITRSDKWQPRYSELASARNSKLLPTAKSNSAKSQILRFVNRPNLFINQPATGTTDSQRDRPHVRARNQGDQCLVKVHKPKLFTPTALLPPQTRVSRHSKILGLILMDKRLWKEYELHILPPDAIVNPPDYPKVDNAQVGGTEAARIRVSLADREPKDRQDLQTDQIGGITSTSTTNYIQVPLDFSGPSTETLNHDINLQRQSQPPENNIINSSVSMQKNQSHTNDDKSETSMAPYSYEYQTLPYFRSIPKISLSLLQLFFGITTLASNPGRDLINQYGSSAFSLAIAPYIFMSTINLLANWFCPEYPTLFLVRNSIMDEVEERMKEKGEKQTFFGVVGHLQPKGAGKKTTNDGNATTTAHRGTATTTTTSGSEAMAGLETATTERSKMLAVIDSKSTALDRSEAATVGGDGKSSSAHSGAPTTIEKGKGKAAHNGLETSSNFRPPIGDNSGDTPIVGDQPIIIDGSNPAPVVGGGMEVYYKSLKPGILMRLFKDCPDREVEEESIDCNQTLQVPSCEDFKIHDRREKPREKFGLLAIRLLYLTILIGTPFFINAGLTKFQGGPKSTSLERGFTLAWLFVGQIIGGALGWAMPIVMEDFEAIDPKLLRSLWRPFLWVILILADAAPALGGYYVVFKMLKDYGNCKQLS